MSVPLSRDPRIFMEQQDAEDQPLETLQAVETIPPRPFALWGILITGVFLPVIIPIMVAVNWRRLGRPQRTIPTLVLGFLGFMVMPFLYYIFVLVMTGFAAYLSGSIAQGILLMFPFITLLVQYIGLIKWQSSAYKRWVEELGITPNFWRLGCLGYLGMAVVAYWLGVEAINVFYGWLWRL
jgi:hypothetical protein